MNLSVYHRFLKSYNCFPDNYAINCNDTNYTYKEVAQIISNIRLQIKDKDQSLIGVVTGDDIYAYASILAILSIGAGYVPINHKNPKDRNHEIIADAGLKLILSGKPSFEVSASEIELICTNKLQESVLDVEPFDIHEDRIAYLFFTSGSTGKPKGVPIRHKNLNAFMHYVVDSNLYHFNSSDRFIQMFELTFDLSVFSFFAPLSVGACCYVIPETGVQYLQIIKCLEEQKISVALLVPSVLNFLKAYFDEILLPEMRYNLFCGEALYEKLVIQWEKCVPNSIIHNVYGPTEATIFYTTYLWDNIESTSETVNGIVSIGKPMGDLNVFIIDENNHILPKGTTGELCLSGNQVTDQYWSDAEKTKKSFITVSSSTGEFAGYKTGDLCYINKNDNIVYCGRIDNQIKIQGYRVELSEIEFQAKNFEGVHNSVAISVVDKKGNNSIVLFLEQERENNATFVQFLKKKLPQYMIPERIINIDKFPINLNGKIDKNKLKELI
jgi:D-alanine--poly(phosphoribitol) ligase subunit 1